MHKLGMLLLSSFLLGAVSYSSQIQPMKQAHPVITSSELHPDAICQAWAEGQQYTVGEVVTYLGQTYTCIESHFAFVGSGWNPIGSPDLWQPGGTCSPTSTPVPTATPAPTLPPATGLIFSPYKDVTINYNYNTNVVSTNVTGTSQPLSSAMPSGLKTMTLAFATGECGSETWAGLTPLQIANNVPALVAAGKSYIISTGGADGIFTCGSDAGFAAFISTYSSANMLGVDFDIEGGQTQSDIDNLVQRVKVAQVSFPNLRFSFTLATLGGNSGQSLSSLGVMVMNSIQSAHLQNYLINLMTMDYGSANPSVCTVGSNGLCDMGQSAIQAAKNLNSYWKVPYSQMELTPMIGGNDVQNEVFTIANVATVTNFALQNGIAGIHFWSFDRDNDCPPGAASPTCNSYGLAGTLGFTNQFLSLGL